MVLQIGSSSSGSSGSISVSGESVQSAMMWMETAAALAPAEKDREGWNSVAKLLERGGHPALAEQTLRELIESDPVRSSGDVDLMYRLRKLQLQARAAASAMELRRTTVAD